MPRVIEGSEGKKRFLMGEVPMYGLIPARSARGDTSVGRIRRRVAG